VALAAYTVPTPGQVVMCDFGPDPANIEPPGVMTGPLAVTPEIFKERHAVVLSARFGIATVVPISTSVPRKIEHYHVKIPAGSYPFLSMVEDSWVKADLIESASNARLDRPFLGGKRSIVEFTPADFKRVRQAVLHALALGFLTGHL
jgi:uncharacterized protein YifN (PemK superfamily)